MIISDHFLFSYFVNVLSILHFPLLNTFSSLTGASTVKEKNWDNINTANTVSSLLESARNVVEWEGLLAAMDRDSGAWLHALPISSMGLRMDDSTVRTAVGLRLGTTICSTHLLTW